MYLDPKLLTRQENYKLLISSVLPRPIAFVTSKSEDGVLNGAPFSFYNVVTSDPPLISISVGRKQNGERKDTSRNILSTKEFVVHVVDWNNVHAVNETAANYPAEVSEIIKAGLTEIPSKVVAVPAIKEAKVRLECKLHQSIPLGGTTEAPITDLIIGEVVHYYVEDPLYKDGLVNTEKLLPLSRLAGLDYGKIGEIFPLERPSVK